MLFEGQRSDATDGPILAMSALPSSPLPMPEHISYLASQDDAGDNFGEDSFWRTSLNSLQFRWGRDDEEEADLAESQTADWRRRHRCSCCVVTEDNSFRNAWNIVLAGLLVYTGTVFPYRLCFVELGMTYKYNTGGFWRGAEMCVDILFYIDLIANFFFTYNDRNGREVLNLPRIARRYLQTYFLLNFIACIPPELIGFIMGLSSSSSDFNSSMNKGTRLSRLQRISRLARLTRLTRLTKLVSFVMENPMWRWFQSLRGVRVVNFVFGLFWAVHLVACGWYLCASMHSEHNDTWVFRRGILYAEPLEQWFHAMYFVLTVFTTVGFGDISANTMGEIAYGCFTMVLGAVVHSIIMSEVINIVMSVDQAALDLSNQKELVVGFTSHAELSSDVAKDLQKFFEQTRTRRPTFDRDKMRSLLTCCTIPRDLLSLLIGALFNGLLENNTFITSCLRYEKRMPPRFPLLVALAVNQRYCLAKEMVYCAYDHPWNVCLVLKGTFANLAFPTEAGGVADLPPECIHPMRRSQTGEEKLKPQTESHRRSFSGTLFDRNHTGSRKSHLAEWEDLETNRHSYLYPYQFFGRGTYFGDIEILSSVAQRARFSSTRCESEDGGILLVLHKTELAKLMQDFPRFSTAWRSRARRREEHRLILVRRLTRGWKHKDFAAWTIQGHVREKLLGYEIESKISRKRKDTRHGTWAGASTRVGPMLGSSACVSEGGSQLQRTDSGMRSSSSATSRSEFSELRVDMMKAMTKMQKEMVQLIRNQSYQSASQPLTSGSIDDDRSPMERVSTTSQGTTSVSFAAMNEDIYPNDALGRGDSTDTTI